MLFLWCGFGWHFIKKHFFSGGWVKIKLFLTLTHKRKTKKTSLASSSVWSHRLACFPRLDVGPGMYRQQRRNKALPLHRLRLIKLKKSEQQNITPMFGNNTITHFEKNPNPTRIFLNHMAQYQLWFRGSICTDANSAFLNLRCHFH